MAATSGSQGNGSAATGSADLIHPSLPNAGLAPFSLDDELAAYREMLLIRRFEERAGQMYGMGLIGGFCHLYIGQEAVVVGMNRAIKPGDQTITGYRDHAHMLACGIPPKMVMAELTGIDYFDICVACTNPAIIYFLSVSMYVELRARKLNMIPVRVAVDYPKLMLGLPCVVVPIGLLIVLMMLDYSPNYAAFWTLMATLAATKSVCAVLMLILLLQ